MSDLDERLLATPYRLGGRELGRGIDCLGVTLVRAAARGLCAPDPWLAVAGDWATGELCSASGFPTCWIRVPSHLPLCDGDVLLFYGERPWAAFVDAGYVWSAHPGPGVYCSPVVRWRKRPDEQWRHDPAVCAARPAR